MPADDLINLEALVRDSWAANIKSNTAPLCQG